MEDESTAHGRVNRTRTAASEEVKVTVLIMTDRAWEEVASMEQKLLNIIDLQFCEITFLINIETSSISVISLVELGTMYKLRPGRVKGKGL